MALAPFIVLLGLAVRSIQSIPLAPYGGPTIIDNRKGVPIPLKGPISDCAAAAAAAEAGRVGVIDFLDGGSAAAAALAGGGIHILDNGLFDSRVAYGGVADGFSAVAAGAPAANAGAGGIDVAGVAAEVGVVGSGIDYGTRVTYDADVIKPTGAIVDDSVAASATSSATSTAGGGAVSGAVYGAVSGAGKGVVREISPPSYTPNIVVVSKSGDDGKVEVIV